MALRHSYKLLEKKNKKNRGIPLNILLENISDIGLSNNSCETKIPPFHYNVSGYVVFYKNGVCKLANGGKYTKVNP